MCDLCKLEGYLFKVTICNTCRIPMIVSSEHKSEFSEEEKEFIRELFWYIDIRWEQRKIKDHAHAHLIV